MIKTIRPYLVGFYFVFMITGLFYPWLGFGILICMAAPITVALFKGRFWCGNFCPRGSFFDVVMSKFSSGKPVPKLFRFFGFKVAVVVGMMGVFAFQMMIYWGDWQVIGEFLIRMLIITSLIGFVLSMVYNQRSWCSFCPMGTLSSMVGRAVKSSQMKVDFSCTGCKACQRACPIGLEPSLGKESGIFDDPKCMKCGQCVAACPQRALSL